MKKQISLFAAALALSSLSVYADFPNQAQSNPGDIISKSHPELGRLTTIDILGDYIIAIPEQPSSPDGADFLVRAIDISDPKNPRTVGTFGKTKHPVLAHGSYKRGNELYIGGWPTDAIILEDDGSLTHGQWSGWRVTDFGKTGHSHPWAVKHWWSYNEVSGNATIKINNQQVAEWDHLGQTGVIGFPTVMGNILLYGSDQSMSGAAAYDISDPTNPVLLDVLKLPAVHPTIKDTKWSNGKTVESDVPYGLGGYWYEVHGHYMVFARRLDNPGVQVVDFSDPSNLRLHCDVLYRDPKHGLTDVQGTNDPMYLNFQDEYIFAEKLKINIETCEVEEFFDELKGGIETNQYQRPIGNLLLTGGGHNYALESRGDQPGGLGIWAHQAERDTRAPYVAYHIPKAGQTNYPTGAPISLMIPETLHSTTIIPGDTLKITKVGGAEVEVDYVLSHTGLLTVDPQTDLDTNSTYEVQLKDIEDAVHNKMATYTFRFSTGNNVSGAASSSNSNNDNSSSSSSDNSGSNANSSSNANNSSNANDSSTNDSSASDTSTANQALSISSVSVSPRSTVILGESVTISVAASDPDGDALEYRYRQADGESYSSWTTASSKTITYDNLGNHNVTVQVRDGNGSQVTSVAHVAIVDNLVLGEPSIISGPMALSLNGDFFWVVNPDNDTVTKISTDTSKVLAEISVGDNPTSVAVDKHNRAWVTLKDEDAIAILNQDGRRFDTIDLDYGSAPSSILFNSDGNRAFVALENTGEVLRINRWTKQISARTRGLSSPKGMALSNDQSRLLVTRYISGQHWGEVYDINTGNMSLTKTIKLKENMVPDDIDNGRGVPNYLSSVLIDGQDNFAYVVGKKDNTARGLANGNADLDDDNTVRTMIAKIDMSSRTEVVSDRFDFDNADSPSSLAISDNGLYLFAGLQGNNQVAVLSRNTVDGSIVGNVSKFATGLAPRGLLFDSATEQLFVKNYTDRSVSTVDLANFLTGNLANPVITTTSTVDEEQLSDEVLLGKQIFHNASQGLDEAGEVTGRMSGEGYLSCASCHADGTNDGRVWDFTGRGEGLRNNISLVGRMGTRFGNAHWSGNFDEIQDFENDIRHNQLGRGLMTDGDFDSTESPLSAPKEGYSEELDALAAYVESLGKDSLPRSPFRNNFGELTSQGSAGEKVFQNLGCNSCHQGKQLTDGALHNVGTLREYSGSRLGLELPGIMTPSLLGVFNSAPYLHDGSARTLEDVFKVMGGDVLQAEQATLNNGAEVVTPVDFSHFRNGSGVKLPTDATATLTAYSNNHQGVVRVRYSTAAADATMQLTVNNNIYTQDLATLPAVDGVQTAFEEATFSVTLASGANSIVVGFDSKNSNDVVYIDDLTVSTAVDASQAVHYSKMQSATDVEQAYLIAYLKQIDQASAPEDDEDIQLSGLYSDDTIDDGTTIDSLATTGVADTESESTDGASSTTEESIDSGAAALGAGSNGPLWALFLLSLLSLRSLRNKH